MNLIDVTFMSTNKIYKPQENHFQLKFISPGAICKFNRYPFYYMTSEQFSAVKDRLVTPVTLASFVNKETTIFDINTEDRFVFLRIETVSVSFEDKDSWNIGAFLYNEQVVFISEDVLEDSVVTVLT